MNHAKETHRQLYKDFHKINYLEDSSIEIDFSIDGADGAAA
jgi:hypothetical protein